MRRLNAEFRYGFTDEQLVEIIHAVAGYGFETIPWDRFNRYVLRKIEKRRMLK